ncbi:GlcG/HbpS family heme-binding protein [Flavobacterium anhuiense]|uniref:GlcG/HbpS family heme-binding protein n=1 Tax=Flavobacterium anhuiense TaxID=459526 RepID=UPI000E6C98EB|nr:heme-binding protein [Flavobacterium anhuiense]
MNITLEQAETVIAAAKRKSIEINTKMVISVLDAGTNLVALARMDDALLGSIDVSIKKAKTSALLQMDTATLTPLVKPEGPFFNLEHSNGGLITFAGGVVIKNSAGIVIGAVGVSGGSLEDDHIVAEAGAKAVL